MDAVATASDAVGAPDAVAAKVDVCSAESLPKGVREYDAPPLSVEDGEGIEGKDEGEEKGEAEAGEVTVAGEE